MLGFRNDEMSIDMHLEFLELIMEGYLTEANSKEIFIPLIGAGYLEDPIVYASLEFHEETLDVDKEYLSLENRIDCSDGTIFIKYSPRTSMLYYYVEQERVGEEG